MVPFLQLEAAQPGAAEDADVEDHPVQRAELGEGFVEHPRHVRLAADIGRDGDARAVQLIDGALRRGAADVRHRHPRAFPGVEPAHGAAVADGVGDGIESALAVPDDQDAAAGEATAPGGFAGRLWRERQGLSGIVRHQPSLAGAWGMVFQNSGSWPYMIVAPRACILRKRANTASAAALSAITPGACSVSSERFR